MGPDRYQFGLRHLKSVSILQLSQYRIAGSEKAVCAFGTASRTSESGGFDGLRYREVKLERFSVLF